MRLSEPPTLSIFALDIKLKLSSSTESELLSLQSQLRNTKAGVAAELQRNVFKKCAQETVGCIDG
jgi:hypothetical protein